MSQKQPQEIEQIIKNIEYHFSETKKNCNQLYKEIDNAKTKEKCDDLIVLYKKMIESLKIIKEESRNFDNIEVPVDLLITEDSLNDLRTINYNNIQSMAQHIRGCIQSCKDYNNKIKESNN